MVSPALFIAIRRRRLKRILQNGAFIVDIREPYEFEKGHIAGAVNIPKNVIEVNVNKLQQLKMPIIICGPFAFQCFSTVNRLSSYGLEVYNGGSWFLMERIKNSI